MADMSQKLSRSSGKFAKFNGPSLTDPRPAYQRPAKLNTQGLNGTPRGFQDGTPRKGLRQFVQKMRNDKAIAASKYTGPSRGVTNRIQGAAEGFLKGGMFGGPIGKAIKRH